MTDDADSLNASITPCLSFLNGSIAPFSSPRQSSSRGPKAFENQKKKQKHGFPIKDFGNDEGGRCLAKFQA